MFLYDSSSSALYIKRYMLVLVVVAFLYHIQELTSSQLASEVPLRRRNYSSTPGKRRKVILLWNTFFKSEDFGVGLGIDPFENSRCPRTCFVTTNKSLLNIADAVVFHAYNQGPDFPKLTIPKRGHPDQKYVFFILESPMRSVRGFKSSGIEFNDVFNLTFTYFDDPDTDIVAPVGYAVKKDTPNLARISRNENFIKSRSVMWLVSNCGAPSSRDQYVKELSKHIQVDTYGKCGMEICPKPNSYTTKLCLEKWLKKYRFLIAFENSYCKDYMTEKVFRALAEKFPIIPIVLGAGEYKKHLPPHSFIDVRDFNSPKGLARHLNHLSRNQTAFREYFDFKSKYDIHFEGDSKTRGFCRLCEILNTEGYPFKSNFDVMEYWNPKRQCIKGDEELQAVHLL